MSNEKSFNNSDLIVIGAGIVGLATAYQFLEKFPNKVVRIFEKERDVAAHQSGHNSGVIHSGIYYKPGSKKALNCIRGYNYLIDFAAKHKIPFDICGKIIVAITKEECIELDKIYAKGIRNGLDGIRYISQNEIREIEPYCAGIKGIYVPQSGIIDYKELCVKLKELIKEKGGVFSFKEKVVNMQKIKGDLTQITTNNSKYFSSCVVSCAGLYSDKVTKFTETVNDLSIIPFRGEYYTIKPEKSYLVKNLIYPVPDPNFPFLGVHFTRMIGGGVEAGPNAVLAFKREGYSFWNFDLKEFLSIMTWPGFWKIVTKYGVTGFKEMYRSLSKKEFTKSLQKLIPEITENDIIRGSSGVRAQACNRKGELLDDFDIVKNDNIIHVRNAPSPAATSSLAIGEYIVQLISN